MSRLRRSSVFPSFAAIAAAMLVCVQVLLPMVHARHLASHLEDHQDAGACCHHGHHQSGDRDIPEDDDDDSCPTCLTLAGIRLSGFVIEAPHVEPLELIELGTPARSSSLLAAPDTSSHPARGPPAA